MLYSICYFSTANASLSDTDFKTLFDNILKKNAANNIIGVLEYDGGNFMQILEGSKIDVINTYSKKHLPQGMPCTHNKESTQPRTVGRGIKTKTPIKFGVSSTNLF